MMIAMFGDTDANIKALRAAYRAVEIKAEKIFHLGDFGAILLF
jgi:hypothetical protein